MMFRLFNDCTSDSPREQLSNFAKSLPLGSFNVAGTKADVCNTQRDGTPHGCYADHDFTYSAIGSCRTESFKVIG
jgi:hypothetical protein